MAHLERIDNRQRRYLKRRSKALEHLAILLYGRYSPRTAPNCPFLRNQKYRVSTVATDTIMG